MPKNFKKLIYLKLIILIQIFPILFSFNKYGITSELYSIPSQDYLRNIPKNNFYILGPGDKLKISVTEDAKELDSTFIINGNGTANLKRLKNIYVEGLTLEELKLLLNKEYSKYVINPDVQLEVYSYRAIKVYIDGEVENPGQYILNGSFDLQNENINQDLNENLRNRTFSNSTSISDSAVYEDQDSTPTKTPIIFPTLFDVIRKSSGITVNANLREIIVTRKNNLTEGGGRIKTKIDLLKVLNLEDPSQNIRILDGDTIFIPRGDNLASVDIAKAIKSNINPATINVYVGGRVEMPGRYQIAKTSSLSDAVEIGGGTKILKGPVRLIRYNNNGEVSKIKLRYRPNKKKGSSKNPYLKNGDIIYVGKSSFNIASEIINDVTSPLQGLVSIYGLYKVFE